MTTCSLLCPVSYYFVAIPLFPSLRPAKQPETDSSRHSQLTSRYPANLLIMSTIKPLSALALRLLGLVSFPMLALPCAASPRPKAFASQRIAPRELLELPPTCLDAVDESVDMTRQLDDCVAAYRTIMPNTTDGGTARYWEDPDFPNFNTSGKGTLPLERLPRIYERGSCRITVRSVVRDDPGVEGTGVAYFSQIIEAALNVIETCMEGGARRSGGRKMFSESTLAVDVSISRDHTVQKFPHAVVAASQDGEDIRWKESQWKRLWEWYNLGSPADALRR